VLLRTKPSCKQNAAAAVLIGTEVVMGFTPGFHDLIFQSLKPGANQLGIS
jgi:hypothetical protein